MNQKTLYLVVAAAILIFLGATVLFLIQDSSSSYASNSDAQETQAECTFLKSNLETASEANQDQQAQAIHNKAKQKGCEWAESSSPGSTGSSGSTTDYSESNDWTVLPSGAPCQWISGDNC